MISLKSFQNLPVSWTQRTYGRVNKTTYYYASVDVPGFGSVQIGDPWPGKKPNREELDLAMRAEWQQFTTRRNFVRKIRRGETRSNPSQQPVCALVKETERGEEVVSTHSSTELAEAAMRRRGGEPGTPFKNGFDIVYLRGHEIVKLPGGRRVIRVKSRANPSGGVGGASSPYGGKKASELVPKRHIEMFVGKYHVGTPDEEIVAALAKKIDSAPVKWPANARKYALEYAVKTHHKNRDLYVAVMSGR